MHLKFSILNLFLLFMRCRYCVEAGGHSVRCVVTRRDAGGGGGGEVPHQKTEQVTQQGAQQDLEHICKHRKRERNLLAKSFL